MPEIAEVARVVHYLQKSLVGKILKSVQAQDDTIVYGKVGTSGAEVQKALMGKKVLDAGRQGKYFWLIMSSPPHPVFHFGMTGWFYVKGEPSIHYRPKGPVESDTWPPKYWKLLLETDSNPPAYAAFTDARRLARIRLVDCAAEDIRKTTPLKENGPDPTLDQHILTQEWFEKKMLSKRVPIKALLLDQANISGIGNWVGDEILYHAKIHPEQYSNTLSSAQLKQLHTSMLYVCQTAVDLLADSSEFPEEWLFKHRWGKGKKDAPKHLPNGAAITHVTVGGRTSCVVPSVQKKTGAVAGDISGDEISESKAVGTAKVAKKAGRGKAAPTKVEDKTSDDEVSAEPKKARANRKRKISPPEEEDSEMEDVKPATNGKMKKRKVAVVKDEDEDEVNDTKPTSKAKPKKKSAAPEDAEETVSTKSKPTPKSKPKKPAAVEKKSENGVEGTKGRGRRSGRISK